MPSCPDCGAEIAERDFPAAPWYGTKCRCSETPRPDPLCHICVLLRVPAEHDILACPIGPNERYDEALKREAAA